MGQVRHGSATTTRAVRAAVQRSQASIAQSSQTCGINPRTMSKWRKRDGVDDLETGPKEPRSSVLSQTEEALIIAFRRHASLPLDDRLHALQPTIPHLTRSSLHRCLQRHGISRLPDVEGNRPERRKFNRHPIGHVHVDIAEGRTEEGKLRLLVATDRTSRFTRVDLHEKAGKMMAARFLRNPVEQLPCKIHTVLTDNAIPLTNRRCDKWAFQHIVERVCQDSGTEHRSTRINHPWTNGQVERMNRTIKEATVKRHHHADHDQLQGHITDLVGACNDARRLKTLKGLTPTNTSAKSGQNSQKDSNAIRSIK